MILLVYIKCHNNVQSKKIYKIHKIMLTQLLYNILLWGRIIRLILKPLDDEIQYKTIY